MKNYDLIVTKDLHGYGVGIYDSSRDCIARWFGDFTKSDAREIVQFCNRTIKTREKFNAQMCDEIFVKVIQAGKKYYAVKSFELSGGRNLTVSSRGFSSEIAACRCGAILEILSDVQFISDGDSDDV